MFIKALTAKDCRDLSARYSRADIETKIKEVAEKGVRGLRVHSTALSDTHRYDLEQRGFKLTKGIGHFADTVRIGW